jgi:hypothetical protein
VPATGPKGEAISVPGPLATPAAETVDSGTLWTSEFTPGGWRVDAFNASTGAFISQLAPSQEEGLSYFTNGLAVGHSTGETELYVGADTSAASRPEGVIAVFNAAGERQATWTGADTPSGHFGCFECTFRGDVAVDRSTNFLEDWAVGDVYVAATEERVVDVFAPEASGGEKYVTQITGTSPSEPFSRRPEGVAVDEANGTVLVFVGIGIDIFKPTVFGEYEFVRRIAGTPNGPFPDLPNPQIAVGGGEGNGDIYYATGEKFEGVRGEVDEFNSEGVYIGSLTGASASELFTSASAVAVDPESHDVYVATNGAIDIFGPDLVVPDDTTMPPTGVKGNGQGQIELTFNGTVNPDGAGAATCKFEFGTSEGFGEEVPCSSSGESPFPASADVSGLLPDTNYSYRLVASNANGTSESPIAHFRTPGPGVHGEAVSAARSESATFEARLDPNGSPTTYYFQYGTSTAYGAAAPALNGGAGASAGAGEGDAEVSQHVQNLQAGTLYHYRLVAVSELASGEIESFFGPDQTFTTQPNGVPFQLPDGRAWEMVSPPQKEGALFTPQADGGSQAAASGNAFVNGTFFQPTELAAAGSDNLDEDFFGRGAAGWVSKTIMPPHERESNLSVGVGNEYRAFSEDLSKAIVQPFGGFTQLAPEATEATAYLHTNYLNGDPGQLCAAGCFRPLVTAANVPPGTKFGDELPDGECIQGEGFGLICGPVFVAGTPDFSHILLTSTKVPLTVTPLENQGGMYEWSGGKLELVNILPPGEANAEGGPVAEDAGIAGERHTLSDDGSRVIWMGKPARAFHLHLYLRDTGTGETIRLDLRQAGAPAVEEAQPIYMTASSDDSRIFFVDRGLTADSSVGFDLYEYNLSAPAGSRVTDLSVDHNAGEPANVAMVGGASDDGSYVYFTASGALTPGAAPGKCAVIASEASICNLYVSHDGQITFIAGLSPEDTADSYTALKGLPIRVSPNGRWLAFMSNQNLTGYDTTDAVSRHPDEEVYLYDALQNKLVCASCDPTGARPVGVEGNETSEGDSRTTLLELGFGSHAWIASSVVGWSSVTLTTALDQPRYLSDSGRLFFNSYDALSPQDVNGTADVYEYEPPGVGDCGTDSVRYSARSGGCVDLISSGTSNEESAFLDASESGGDVFFLTGAQLVPQDFDNAPDIYDAHECTTLSPCIAPAPAAPPPCDNADSCKPAQSVQPTAFGAGPSETFTGAGNVTPSAPTVQPQGVTRAQKLAQALHACAHVKGKRRRAACVRRARKKYGGGAAGKAARGARKARRDLPAGARR